MIDKRQKMMIEPEAIGLISKYGLAYPEYRLVNSSEDAARFAESIGRPVVFKVISPELLHKSDVGGVMTGIMGAKSAAQAYRDLMARMKRNAPEIEITGILVCRQADPGLEVVLGGVRDPSFGPTVMFGLGGVFTEVIKDVSFRIAPLERIDAEEMIDEIRGRSLLNGYRGQPAIHRGRLIDALQAVGRMMVDCDDVEELDLNPVRLYSDDLLALDVRIIKKQE